jgi:hypothetical protein
MCAANFVLAGFSEIRRPMIGGVAVVTIGLGLKPDRLDDHCLPVFIMVR